MTSTSGDTTHEATRVLVSAAVLPPDAAAQYPTHPTNGPIVFTVALRAANEVPPVTNADANGARHRDDHAEHHARLPRATMTGGNDRISTCQL